MTTIDTLNPTVAAPPGALAVDPGDRRHVSEWAPLAVLMAGVFMIVLDFFIVNVALPAMQTSLGASTGQLEWVVAGYGLTFAVFLIAAARLGDRVGRRRCFTAGLGLFVATSALCGLAPNAAVLVGARFGQGLAGALISPNLLSILGVVYPGERRVRALTVYGMVMGLAAASGQVIGGLLMAANVAGSGWRAIFLINLPVGAAGLVLAGRLIPESRSDDARRIDLAGMGLASAAILALVLPLIEGHDAGWAPWTWASLSGAAVLAVAFTRHQRWLAGRGGAPLLDPAVFRVPGLRAGLATQLAFWCGQASFYLILALYLQDGRGMRPLSSGLVFTVLAAAYLVVSSRAPELTVRYGRDLILAGAALTAAGDAALYLFVHHYAGGGTLWLLAPGLILVGAGQGAAITPLTTTVMAHSTPSQAGAVSGALSTMQQVGNSLGVAVTGAVFYSALSRGYPTAFGRGVVELAVLLAGVAVLTRTLPASRRVGSEGGG